MKILVTNDDGYRAKGLKTLVNILKPYGEILVVAPKYVQSGTSMGVTMGYKPIAVKKLSEKPGEIWYYLDGTGSTTAAITPRQPCIPGRSEPPWKAP